MAAATKESTSQPPSQSALSVYIVYDVETTSNRSHIDDIMQFAAYCVNDGSKFNQYVVPKVEVHPDALRIHGITPAVLSDNKAVNFAEMQKRFDEWLAARVYSARIAANDEKEMAETTSIIRPVIVYFIGHNSNSFDRHIWLANMVRYDALARGAKPGKMPSNWMFVCTMNAIRAISPGQVNYKLDTLIKKYVDSQQLQTHRADDDVYNLLLVLRKLLLGRASVSASINEDIMIMEKVVVHTTFETMSKLNDTCEHLRPLVRCKNTNIPTAVSFSSSSPLLSASSSSSSSVATATVEPPRGEQNVKPSVSLATTSEKKNDNDKVLAIRSKYFYSPPPNDSAKVTTTASANESSVPLPATLPSLPFTDTDAASSSSIFVAPMDAAQKDSEDNGDGDNSNSATAMFTSSTSSTLLDKSDEETEVDERDKSTQEASQDLLEDATLKTPVAPAVDCEEEDTRSEPLKRTFATASLVGSELLPSASPPPPSNNTRRKRRKILTVKMSVYCHDDEDD